MSRKRQPIERGRVLDAQHIQNQLKLSRSELRQAREAQKVALDEVAAACARVQKENADLRKERDDLRVIQSAWLASPEAAKRLAGYRELGAKCAALENGADRLREVLRETRKALEVCCVDREVAIAKGGPANQFSCRVETPMDLCATCLVCAAIDRVLDGQA